ncbi:hypothetical protein ACFX13_035004 [Malus domestica]
MDLQDQTESGWDNSKAQGKAGTQKPVVNFNETFTPVARLDTVRTLMALSAQKKWKLYQLDVKSTFLNRVLQDEVFIDQPDGYIVQGVEDNVYKLKKVMYGLKQAPRAWYEEINAHLYNCGFTRNPSEATLYMKSMGENESVIISIYVDDICLYHT